MSAVLTITSVVWVIVNWMPKWVWGELVWKPIASMTDPKVIAERCVRGFVYSKEDLAIDWRDVEHYANLAEEKGLQVEKMLVHGSEHVQQFKGKEGEKGYWGFLKKVWELGNERE